MLISLTTRRSVIALSGVDRFNFLQGLITNNINKISDKNAIYAYILTPQGRFLYDMFIIEFEDKLLIDIPKDRKDEVLEYFKKYKLRSKVALIDLDEQTIVLSSINEPNEVKNLDLAQNIISYIDPRSAILGNRIISMIQTKLKEEELYSNLIGYDEVRISNFITDGEMDMIYDKSFPLEYESQKINAIDFEKGCYVGQEVITRTWRRGVIRKKLYLLTAEANIMAQKGDEILADGEKVGIIGSSANNIALGLIKEELISNKDNSCNITINGIKITNLRCK